MYWQGRQEAAPIPGLAHSGGRPLSQAAQSEGIRISAEVLAAVLAKEAASADNPDEALAASLTRLYPGLADNGYFVLWRGTVDVCSPLTPDTAGLDFGHYRDAAGNLFIQDLKRLADSGGGFASFSLAKAGYERPKSYGLSGPGQGQTGGSNSKIPYIAYSTPVNGTDMHLTLWRQAVPTANYNLQAELSDGGNWSALGLCMAGLSFLGVSVLLRNFEK